jgi:hypothetical protein
MKSACFVQQGGSARQIVDGTGAPVATHLFGVKIIS